MNNRRKLIVAFSAGALSMPLVATAQPAKRMYRVGILRPTFAPKSRDRMATEFALRTALEKLGYTEGRNLAFEPRYADGKPERLPALAKELVQLGVDAIVAVGAASARAAKQATATVPIILYGNMDPVAAGLVSSLARPGANVTGVLIAPDGTLAAKKLELLKETVSGASRIAVLVPEDRPNAPTQLEELSQAAAQLRIELHVVDVRGNDYAEAFARIAAARPHALFVFASTYFALERMPIIALTKKYRLPSMWEWREQVEDGGLMSYGSSLAERAERIAEHIDRIFKGRAPGDLPVDRPMSFELAVNLKTAKALSITIPPIIMVQVTRVIE